jgi:hypothetical protein
MAGRKGNNMIKIIKMIGITLAGLSLGFDNWRLFGAGIILLLLTIYYKIINNSAEAEEK